MKRKLWLASLGVVLVTSLVFSLGAKKMLRAEGDVVAPEEAVAIDATNFPDDTFRGYVKQFDKNGDSAFGEEELKKVYEIDCSNRKISSLKGIEFFTELEKLDCSINSLKELDVSQNKKLKVLNCKSNFITALDISNNTKLEKLNCVTNKLKSLDIRKCEQLQEVDCFGNQLEEFLTTNEKLVTLNCNNNKLKKLNLRYCTELAYLYCYQNELEELDVSRNKNLLELYCHENKLIGLNVTANIYLKGLSCSKNPLSSLDLTYNEELIYFAGSECSFVSLNVSENPKLRHFYCSINKLKALDVSNNKELRILSCQQNSIEALDVTNNPELEDLDCRANPIAELDLSANVKLTTLYCDVMKLSSLDVSMLPDLTILHCGHNNAIETLDVSNCKELTELSLPMNKVKSLDVSMLSKLEALDCANNELTSVDVSTLSELTDLACNGNHISSVDVSNNAKLVLLNVAENQLTSLDVSKNPELVALICSDNQLTELDLSNNLQIGILQMQSNKIASVDLSRHVDLYNRVKAATEWKEYETYWAAKNSTRIFRGNRGYGSGWATFAYDKATEVTLVDNSILPKPKNPTPTPTLTPVPGDPITTPDPGKPGDPTPTPDPSKEPSIADFVERLYTIALNRASEPEGKAFWVKEIEDGNRTGGDCAYFFLIESEEFGNRGLSDEDFVETLYLTFFDRNSEADGKAFWVGQLKNKTMTREQVILGFIDSTEWCNVCAGYGVKSGAPNAKAENASKNAIAFATRLYTCCLGREPEEGGLKYWSLALTNLEQTGCSAAKEFFTSEEFVNFNLKDDEYVTRLYTTFMGRDPKPEEVTYWTGEIAKGTQTRDSVLAFFGSCDEFTNICKKYGIDRGTI